MKKYGGKHNSARSDNNMRASMKRKTIRSLSAFFASIFVIPAIFCTQSALGYYDEPGVFYKVSDKIEWLKDHTLRPAPRGRAASGRAGCSALRRCTPAYPCGGRGGWGSRW